MAKWLLLFFVLVFGANGKRSSLYGGTDGENFSDGQSQGIVRVKIWSGYIVDGIQVQSDQGGEHVWSDPHGTSKGETKEVVLAYPDEYIYKISGRTGPNPWTSNGLSRLYLHVNNRRTNAQTTFGPFGTYDYSNQTTFDSPEGTVVGFFGYASSTTYFRGIGVYFQDPCMGGSFVAACQIALETVDPPGPAAVILVTHGRIVSSVGLRGCNQKIL
ncbi:hypothetical protein SELMODRAFT_420315 [Selaginella moellendorffii]|uniref:Jacalin-type lectin domain-containing protein n=1 Tax=Selaginella moellendorffii TaxID=88036 RepID=D8SBL4_SELML|nr:hypothetical protein SELMODRAFT_420315 [Selaginella moellendorffii]